MNKFSVALRLFIITALSAFLLAVANNITAPITKANQEKAFNESLIEALPEAMEFSSLDSGDYKNETVVINSINAGYGDKEHKDLKGYVVMATSSEGYGGKLGVMVGIGRDLKVTNVIISSPFAETPGLGAKADDTWLSQFTGKKANISVIKSGTAKKSEINAISGATITSKAVTEGVNIASAAAKTIYNAEGDING